MNLKISLKEFAKRGRLPFYIDNDGRPIGETPCHVRNVCHLLEPLENWFRADAQVFVAGALVLHYERGRRDRYLSPDIFMVRGISKEPPRRNYLVGEEGRGPDVVIEITSEWTQDEDQVEKRGIYQDILGVKEYFLFDPLDDYLQPRLQGLRLASGSYRPIRRVKGRLPSKVLGLHLEADGDLLRLYDPAAKRWLLTPPETRQELLRLQQEVKDIKADTERLRREREQLRIQTEELRRQLPGSL